jgi:hypothetical protein
LAIFYPPPNPFVGGRQPLEPIKKVPPSVPVDLPPRYRLDWLLAQLNLAWQPGPPLPPATPDTQIISVPVNNPPSYDPQWLLEQLALAWQSPPAQLPPQVFLLPQQVVVAAYVPYSITQWMSEVVAAWQPLPPQPQASVPTRIVSVDNPPPTAYAALYGELTQAWVLPFQYPPTLPWAPIPPPAVVNNPPGYTITSLMAQLVTSWQPGPPLPPVLILMPQGAQPGPPPPSGNPVLWVMGPKGIKTKISFVSGTEPEKES